MQLTVWSRRFGRGEGSGGYAARLVEGLRSRGHEVFAPRITPWRRERRGVVIALDRLEGADVWRAGGGVHALAQAATGRRGGWIESWKERRAARAPVVVANSRMVADQLIGARVPPSRVELVRTGVDLVRFRPGVRNRSRRVVLFAGHGWRRKGFRTAVQAFARAAGPDDQLWVAGRDARREHHLTKARNVLGERVRDLGKVADLSAVLPGVQAVLHPTRYDAAANLVLEAMACGVPVVTTSMDGSAEVVPDPLLVARDPADAGQVGRCLARALQMADPEPFRAAAECWPESRNHDTLYGIASRSVNG